MSKVATRLVTAKNVLILALKEALAEKAQHGGSETSLGIYNISGAIEDIETALKYRGLGGDEDALSLRYGGTDLP